MIEPIGPDDARILKVSVIPEEVIAAVNQLILEKTNKSMCFSIYQKDIINLASSMMVKNGVQFTRNEFFDRGWLDFESIYENAGWTVRYDTPAWDECFEAHFRFSKKPSR